MNILVDLWEGMLLTYPALMTIWEKVSFVFSVTMNDLLIASEGVLGGVLSNILSLLPDVVLSLNLFTFMFLGGFITFVVLVVVKWFIGIVT